MQLGDVNVELVDGKLVATLDAKVEAKKALELLKKYAEHTATKLDDMVLEALEKLVS